MPRKSTSKAKTKAKSKAKETPEQKRPRSRAKSKKPVVIRLISLALLLFVTSAYLADTDGFYAITIWPAFVWSGIGLALLLPGIRRRRTGSFWTLILGWVLFWLAFGEDAARWAHLGDKPGPNDLLVTSMNCAGGMVEAAKEAIEDKPALLLLQESPSKPELEKLTAQVYGSTGNVLWGPDGSIIANGQISPVSLPRGTHNFTAARVTLKGQSPIFVVSLRLQPPVFSLEYWSASTWQQYAKNRENRRQELAEIAAWIRNQNPGSRIIVGGDFNSPPDPGTFKPFHAWLQPASRFSGYTAVNEFPMARIDQIWVSGFEATNAEAYKTQNSDHRLVRCWLKPTSPAR